MQFDDTLEAMSNIDSKSQWDQEYSQLLDKMEEPEPRADLVKKLLVITKAMKKKYNVLVDTNVKLVNQQKQS